MDLINFIITEPKPMSVSYIPEKIKIRLWGKAGGRCQYKGCNKPLWLDSLTQEEFNVAYIAHIIADKPGGPRGDPTLSEKLKSDISNIMLMCDEHHRLIDRGNVEGHPVERLRDMKCKHEHRVELVTSIDENAQTHVVLYGANIGEHHAHVSWKKTTPALIPERYPAQNQAIEMSLKNSSFKDHEDDFWEIEREHLKRQFDQAVKSRLGVGGVEHFSIFALAPQPLLIELGRLLSDIPAAQVFQLHREPPDWKWQDHPAGFEFIIQEPEDREKNVALILSLSATVDPARVIQVLGEDVSIWTLTIKDPNNDFLKSVDQLRMFRENFRMLMDQIKATHGQKTLLHLFPAVPVAVAVEVGRIWMPKADMPIRIYDQNSRKEGFVQIFNINNN